MLLPPISSSPNAPAVDSPESIRRAAQEFESLLIEQMLRAARTESERGSLGPGEKDEAGQTMLDLADQQLARVMSAQGGLGMAKMIEQSLARKAPSPLTAKSSAAPLRDGPRAPESAAPVAPRR